MSRSALWRQEGNVQERERQAQETFLAAVEQGRNNRVRNLVPLYGPDDTFHIHPMLLQSIIKSQYFAKCCRDIVDWNTLVDEIYYQVKHVEPWTVGASKTPSTAFCLLLRLFTIRCTEKQMKLLLEHADSPYIRCIGFLYLRYACEPRQLYTWMEPYLYDDECFRVEANAARPERTMGAYVRGLLSELEYSGTRLPRLPVQVEREIKVKLLQAEHMEARAKSHLGDTRVMGHFQTLGSRVRALYGDDENPVTWYDAVVDRVLTKDDETGAVLKRPKFVVTFPEYGNTEVVMLGEMDMPDGRSSKGEGAAAGRNGQRNEDRRDYGRHDDLDRGYSDRRHQGGWVRDGHRGVDRNSGRESRAIPSERDLMEEVLRKEREKSIAKGRSYASRPPSAKASLSSHHNTHNRKRSPPPRDRSRDRRDFGHGRPEKNPAMEKPSSIPLVEKPAPALPIERSTEEMAAVAAKKRKLMAKYG